jgi:hypothetical protein
MTEPTSSDYYAVLQVSPHADAETIERVFRHLAKRYHPDNADSGDSDRFIQLVEAYRVLSDPEQRAAYDASYAEVQQLRWRVFDQESTQNHVWGDRQLRQAILSVLYTARRNDVDRPGVGSVDLEQILGVPETHMDFQIWYLKERGWIQRLDNGQLAITVSGVDWVMESGNGDAVHGLIGSGGDREAPARPAPDRAPSPPPAAAPDPTPPPPPRAPSPNAWGWTPDA